MSYKRYKPSGKTIPNNKREIKQELHKTNDRLNEGEGMIGKAQKALQAMANEKAYA